MKYEHFCLCALVCMIAFGGTPADADVPPGLIHLWKGDGDGTDSVSGANATLGSTTAFGAGLNGQAFSFNAAQTSVVDLPVDINLDVLPQMTMGMLVNLQSVPNNRGWVMGHDDVGFDRSLILHDNRYGLGLAAGVGYAYASTLPALGNSLGAWHCVAVAYDQDMQTAMVYADGATQLVVANNSLGVRTATLGGLTNWLLHTVDALVDEVFIFNRTLSADELEMACAEFALEPGACCTNGPGTDTECIVNTRPDCEAGNGLFLGASTECVDVLDCTELLVTMASMSATATPRGVLLSWTTVAEVDTVAFRLLRETPGSREKTLKVVASMIPAAGTGLAGASYEFLDNTYRPGLAAQYYIEDIDIFGKVTRHGPIVVERVAPTRAVPTR